MISIILPFFWAACECKTIGVVNNACDENGQCFCKQGFSGSKCEECSNGYYMFKDNCKSGQIIIKVLICVKVFNWNLIPECDCSLEGSIENAICDQKSGKCKCKPNVGGKKCEKCLPTFYDFPNCKGKDLKFDWKIDHNNSICYTSDCACNVKGSASFACGNRNGACICKHGFTGDKCDSCSPSFYLWPCKGIVERLGFIINMNDLFI